MTRAIGLCVVFASAGVFAALVGDGPIIRLATGRDLIRVVVITEPRSDQRALVVDGITTDDSGDVTWERASTLPLDGAEAPRSHTVEWQRPRRDPFGDGMRLLTVHASVVCAKGERTVPLP